MCVMEEYDSYTSCNKNCEYDNRTDYVCPCEDRETNCKINTSTQCCTNCDDCADNIKSVSVYSTMYRDITTVGWTGKAYAEINSQYIGNCGIVWVSSNPDAVRVDSEGNLIAVGEGTAYIRAYVCGNPTIYDSFVIHVAPNDSCDECIDCKPIETEQPITPEQPGGTTPPGGTPTPPTTTPKLSEYKFVCQNGNANKVLNLYTTLDGTTIKDSDRFSLYDDLGSNDQTFVYETYGNYGILRIKRNTDYVLNRDVSNNYAIPWTWSTDSATVNDSLVSFEIVDSVNNVCRIKLVNKDLYLTAQSIGNGAYVTWAVKDTSDAGQRWEYVCLVSGDDLIKGVNCENEEECIPVKSITFDSSILTSISVGTKGQLAVTVSPSNATDKTITYSSNNESVLSIESNYVYKANASGTAEVTARAASGVTKKIDFTVCNCDDVAEDVPVTSVSLRCSSLTTIYIGGSGKITATVSPRNATNKTITYRSSNESVLWCTLNGEYVAKAAGKAVITATAASGVTGTIDFTVCEYSGCDDESDTSNVVDTREKVKIKKDGEFFKVVFSNGLTWKSIGCDLSLDDNRSGFTMWLPEHYDFLYEAEKRYIYNNEREYTAKQLAFLYLLDPLGVEYYVKYYYHDHEDGVKLLMFKDEIYREIFHKEPEYFLEMPSGSIQYYYPEGMDESWRNTVYSSAEILFGFHTVINVATLTTGAIKLVVDAIFSEINNYSVLSTVVHAYKLLFFSGSIKEELCEDAKKFAEDYITNDIESNGSTVANAALNMYKWVNRIFSAIKTIEDAISPPNIFDVEIYSRVDLDNYQTSFVIDSSSISLKEILNELGNK